MIRSLSIFILMLISLLTQAQPKNANSHYFNQELLGQMVSFATNPTYIFHQPDSTYADVSQQWNRRAHNGLYPIQNGNMISDYIFDAQALLKKEKSASYGSAFYQNGYRDGIKWNTMSDVQMHYPYVIADTIGGKSYHETYGFKGGYAGRLGNFIIGAEADYRSSLSYRKLDPRPKNTISDLSLKLGVSYPLASYRLAFDVTIQDYKQSQNIGVYRQGSGIKLFYLRGMGISDVSFSTVITSKAGHVNYYDTFAKAFTFQLYPDENKGMYYSLSYISTAMELLNNYSDLVHSLDKRVYQVEVGYQSVQLNHSINVKAYATADLHDGYEYNYDRSRKLISVSSKYEHNNMMGGVSGIVTARYKDTQRLFVLADVQWLIDREEYVVVSSIPKALQEYTLLNPSFTLGLDKQWPISYLAFKFKTAYSVCLDKTLQTTHMAAPSANETLVAPNYDYVTSNSLTLKPSLRYSHQTGQKSHLYVQAEYLNIQYTNGKPANGFSLALGYIL